MSLSATSNTLFVTRELLEHNAQQHPALVVLKFDTGECYTSVQLLAAVQRHAAGLQALGVKQDDFVLSWLPNGPLAVLVWLALNYAGAIFVPINTAYKGRLLQHVINNSGARLLITDSRWLERLAGINTGHLQQVVVAGTVQTKLPGLALLPASVLTAGTAELQALVPPLPPRGTPGTRAKAPTQKSGCNIGLREIAGRALQPVPVQPPGGTADGRKPLQALQTHRQKCGQANGCKQAV